ncbi:MAG: insulinase family protein [Leptolyngbya sp. PLA3]|nr:MAG: insulinase family protein [Cyanobacteria bacterium CYA]MCE7968922.1 insulinase family protein [Leptolyngbya sp. PL-A3]
MDSLQLAQLDHGAHLIVEKISGVQSVALTWMLPVGPAYDPAHLLGRAAVTGEMLLRGAGSLDSRAFADAADAVGLNRSVEPGTLYMKIVASFLSDRLPDALPLLIDLVRRPRFDDDAFEPSRQLALQALESLQDDPQQQAVLAARQRHYPAPLNRSGMGTPDGLAALDVSLVRSGWSHGAVPQGSIIALAGNVDLPRVHDLLEPLLGGWNGAAPSLEIENSAPRGYAHQPDDTNQAQIVVVHDAPPAPHDHAVLEHVVCSILSGGMSGRLFTEVREKRGLCYAVSASYRSDRDFGSVTGYVGTTPERAQESLDVLVSELARITQGAEQEEFDRAMIGLKSRVIFSGESTPARAAALASDMHKLGRPRSLDEITAELDAVTLDRVNAYLSTRTLGRLTIQTHGPAELTPPTN